MFKVKAQNGTIFMVKRVFVNVFKTVRRTYFFLMGNDTDILGVFVSAKEAHRAETNFNKWAMANDNTDMSVYFNVAQDFYSEEEEVFNKDEILKNKKTRKDFVKEKPVVELEKKTEVKAV